VSKWRGKAAAPAMTRIDIGVVPVGQSGTRVKAFVNEIETEAATWLVRYVPFDIVKRMVSEYPKKISEFIHGLKPGEKKPDPVALAKLADLVKKLEPQGESSQSGKRKHDSNKVSDRTKKARMASLAGA